MSASCCLEVSREERDDICRGEFERLEGLEVQILPITSVYMGFIKNLNICQKQPSNLEVHKQQKQT